MLINLSNHPSDRWELPQKEAALKEFGQIVDIPFPEIQPEWDTQQVVELAGKYLLQCIQTFQDAKDNTGAVHIMGEFTFTFALVSMLQQRGISCIASTTRRMVVDNPDGSRNVQFDFIRFREYPVFSNNYRE